MGLDPSKAYMLESAEVAEAKFKKNVSAACCCCALPPLVQPSAFEIACACAAARALWRVLAALLLDAFASTCVRHSLTNPPARALHR